MIQQNKKISLDKMPRFYDRGFFCEKITRAKLRALAVFQKQGIPRDLDIRDPHYQN